MTLEYDGEKYVIERPQYLAVALGIIQSNKMWPQEKHPLLRAIEKEDKEFQEQKK